MHNYIKEKFMSLFDFNLDQGERVNPIDEHVFM